MSDLNTGNLVVSIDHMMRGINHTCAICKGKGTIAVYWVPLDADPMQFECPILRIEVGGFQAADEILVKLIQTNGPPDVIADVATLRERYHHIEQSLADAPA